MKDPFVLPKILLTIIIFLSFFSITSTNGIPGTFWATASSTVCLIISSLVLGFLCGEFKFVIYTQNVSQAQDEEDDEPKDDWWKNNENPPFFTETE